MNVAPASAQARLVTSPATRALAARTDPAPFIEASLEAILSEVWGHHTSDPALMAALHASVTDNCTNLLKLFAGAMTSDEVGPPANFAFTDLAVEVGIQVHEIEAAYWVSMNRFWRRWYIVASEAAAAGEGTLDEFVGAPTETLMVHLFRMVKMVVARHEAVSETLHRSRNDRRRLLIAQVVDGDGTLALDDIERELGYRFSGTHLALVLQAAERSRVEHLTVNLAERVGAQGLLLTVRGADTWVCWLQFPCAVAGANRAAVESAFEDPDIAVAAGEPGTGIAGFRRTRDDALAVAALRRRFDGFDRFLWFRDVALEVCLLADESAARRFMEDELGQLATSGERADRARETLLAWLSCGSSSLAAARLFLHENTVRMRVSQAQEMLPVDLKCRRAEVLAALRLRAMLGEPV